MRKAVAVILAVLMCVFLSGCTPFSFVVDMFYGDDAVREAENTPHFAFSNGTLFEDSEEVFFPASHFTEVSSAYAQYRGSLYYDALSPEEQNVYLALEYAMENCYQNVLVDCALVQDTDTLIKIIEHFSLDSPLLEQNLRYTVGDFTTSYPVDILGLYTDYARFDGYYISVKNFKSEIWTAKLSALKEAEKIVADLPIGLSGFEKAEKLYLKLARGITYYTYDDQTDEDDVYPYLYDALINGKTHCDGHANALSLLYRLAGIETVEKMYTTEREEDVGHTWVTFCIDGLWYNADSTSDHMIPLKENSMHAGLYFAFSDEIRLYGEDYDEVTPACEESKYMNPDSFIYDLSTDDFSNSVISAFAKRDPDWAFIIVYNNSEKLLDRQLQKCANRNYSTVYWSTVDLANGSTAIVVYTEKIFG